MTDRRRRGEFDLIARFFEPLSRAAPGAFALGNDGALLTPPADSGLVVTKDLMVAGVHYPEGEEPAIIARRLLRVNLSDLAAMGADATAYALGLALPADAGDAWVEAFAAGLARDQEAFGVALIGGDTVATEGPAVLSLTAFGIVENGACLPRAGAREGDDIYVSGTVGDATLGLRAVQGGLAALPPEDRAALAERFRLPEPRLALGTALVGLATCAIDISDGLVADLGHLCTGSGVAARIAAEDVPLSEAARRALAAGEAEIADLVTGGDDYELLFCAPSSEREAIDALGRRLGVALTRIGGIEDGAGHRGLGRRRPAARARSPRLPAFLIAIALRTDSPDHGAEHGGCRLRHCRAMRCASDRATTGGRVARAGACSAREIPIPVVPLSHLSRPIPVVPLVPPIPLVPLDPARSRQTLCDLSPAGCARGPPGNSPRRTRASRGRRCPPRASPRDRAGRGGEGTRSRPRRARCALLGQASRRASP